MHHVSLCMVVHLIGVTSRYFCTLALPELLARYQSREKMDRPGMPSQGAGL